MKGFGRLAAAVAHLLPLPRLSKKAGAKWQITNSTTFFPHHPTAGPKLKNKKKTISSTGEIDYTRGLRTPLNFGNAAQWATVEATAPNVTHKKKREPLSGNAQMVYDILIALPPHKALPAPDILDEVGKKHDKFWDEKELYHRVFPQLRQWGLKNKPRVGYWIEREKSADAPS